VLYFDHNATSPLSPAAREAWLDATSRLIGNPSSQHRLGSRAEAALQTAREQLAARLRCEPHEIVWTSGATEGANTAIRHFAASSPGEAWISAIEHPCVHASVERCFPDRYRLIPVREDGVVDLEWLRLTLVRDRPAFVAVMAANNETGVLQPWRDALEVCREVNVPFFCDAAQWLGKLPASGLGECDFLSGCAHKFGGPAGVGFLKAPGRLRPLLVGGPQEDGRRAGTENVAGALAMLAALEEREASMAAGAVAARLRWRDGFAADFLAQIPGSAILARESERLWNTLSVIMPEIDCRQRWVVKLDKGGAAVSTGSACASGKEQTSHVLAAMGLAVGMAGRVLRISSGWETTEEEWARLLAVMREVYRSMADNLLQVPRVP